MLGLDLFDHGFFWECHEIWEAQWKTRPRRSQSRVLLQGMIQSAAALLKPVGSRSAHRLWIAAEERLMTVLDYDRGIDLPATIAIISSALCGQDTPRVVGGWP